MTHAHIRTHNAKNDVQTLARVRLSLQSLQSLQSRGGVDWTCARSVLVRAQYRRPPTPPEARRTRQSTHGALNAGVHTHTTRSASYTAEHTWARPMPASTHTTRSASYTAEVIVGREVYEWQRGGEATPRASDPRCGRVAPQCMRKAVSNPRSNGHGLSLIDTLCAPLALQYLLNDSHSDA